MTYDDWKLETPEDEADRLERVRLRRQARAEWQEEHADYLRERDEEERRNPREFDDD
jgi:hypothetical protein